MKLCVAQTRPIKGDIQRNSENHKKLIDVAVSYKANLIIFPELSLTGYEPELANDLATQQDDSQFDDFQHISDAKQITIGVGMPTKTDAGIRISLLIFQPHQARQTYSKQHLHSDEYPYFVPGNEQVFLTDNNTKIALAICYELSVPEHSENAFNNGAGIYLASVAKTADGMEKAARSLSEIAQNYSMTVLLSNCVGPSDNFVSGGKTAIWDSEGNLVGQLDDSHEGILLIDTETRQIIEQTV